MNKQELINIACKWMDYHNNDPKYITEKSRGDSFINGGYQTDLRAFLNEVKDKEYWDVLNDLYSKHNGNS